MQDNTLKLGIDLGGTKIEGVLLDSNNRIRESKRVPTPQGDYQAILDTIATLSDALDPGRTLPAGIGTPGSVSRVNPLMRNANSTCLNGQPLEHDLEERLERPVRLANDADCFTLSEASDGAAAGAGNVFGVILGTGVGGGLFLNGGLVTGINGIAGEWGTQPGIRRSVAARTCLFLWQGRLCGDLAVRTGHQPKLPGTNGRNPDSKNCRGTISSR